MGGYNHKGGIFADQRQGGNPLGRWGGLKCENPAFIENGWILQGPLNCIPSFWAIKHTNVHPWTKNGRCFLEGDFGRKPLRGEIPNPMWEKRRDLSFYPRWLLQEVANKLWRGHESKPSLRARSEVAKKTHGGWIDWCFFFPWGNELPKSGTRDSFSFQPFQVRHPNSPTKPLPPTSPTFCPVFFVLGFAWLCCAVWLGEWTQFSLHVRYAFLQSAWEFETLTITHPGRKFDGWPFQKDSPFRNFHFRRPKDLPVLHGFFSAKHVTYLGSCIQGKSGRFQGGLVGGIWTKRWLKSKTQAETPMETRFNSRWTNTKRPRGKRRLLGVPFPPFAVLKQI